VSAKVCAKTLLGCLMLKHGHTLNWVSLNIWITWPAGI